jgi:hypothetical protein
MISQSGSRRTPRAASRSRPRPRPARDSPQEGAPRHARLLLSDNIAPCVRRPLRSQALRAGSRDEIGRTYPHAKATGAKTALVNAPSPTIRERYMHSASWFAPAELFDKIARSPGLDADASKPSPNSRVKSAQQQVRPEIPTNQDLSLTPSSAPPPKILLASSTHTPEESLIAKTWLKLSARHPRAQLS